MTCIAGYVDRKNNTVVIGGDSAEISAENLVIRKDAKVFYKGDFVIGCTTSFRMIQLLRYSLQLPEIKSSITDIYEYMCTDFINAVIKCFNDGGFLIKDSKNEYTGGTFLVGYKNRLFKIQCDFQVSESIIGIDAIGCGGNFALGSLLTTQEMDINVYDKVLKSLQVSEKLSSAVAAPFTILTTK